MFSPAGISAYANGSALHSLRVYIPRVRISTPSAAQSKCSGIKMRRAWNSQKNIPFDLWRCAVSLVIWYLGRCKCCCVRVFAFAVWTAAARAIEWAERARWLLTATQEAAKVGRRSLRNRRALVSHLKVLLTSGVQNSAAEAAHACVYSMQILSSNHERATQKVLSYKKQTHVSTICLIFFCTFFRCNLCTGYFLCIVSSFGKLRDETITLHKVSLL